MKTCELVLPTKRIYVQIKTRASRLISSDIDGALARFDAIRLEHAAGRRSGEAEFAIISNSAPGPDLATKVKGEAWPTDVGLIWPGHTSEHVVLPPPWPTASDGFAVCRTAASSLPFTILAPETLVWKLAGRTMAAAAGVGPNANHAFDVNDLPALFEQMVVQLQDFPSPSGDRRRTRSRRPSPTITSGSSRAFPVPEKRVGLADGPAYHGQLAYYNVADISGAALANAIARELAARLLWKKQRQVRRDTTAGRDRARSPFRDRAPPPGG